MSGRHVFEDRRGDDGSRRYCAAYLNRDGCLVIETHDLGPVAEKAAPQTIEGYSQPVVIEDFGAGEYEAYETFNPDQTARLRESLGEDLIAAIGERFPTSSRGLIEHAESLGVGRGQVWNRIGD